MTKNPWMNPPWGGNPLGQTNPYAGQTGQNPYGAMQTQPGHPIEIDFTKRKDREPPYSFKLCAYCGEYDFAGDFGYCKYADIYTKKERLIQSLEATIVLVCSTCYEKAYLDEEESDEEYKFRMAARLCR